MAQSVYPAVVYRKLFVLPREICVAVEVNLFKGGITGDQTLASVNTNLTLGILKETGGTERPHIAT